MDYIPVGHRSLNEEYSVISQFAQNEPPSKLEKGPTPEERNMA